MFPIIVGSIGFVLYFIYDFNSILKKNRILQKSFLVGTIFVAVASIDMLVSGWNIIEWNVAITYISLTFGLLMLGLLIDTLFFVLPFESTYVEKSKERMAYTEGVYALCRHPGVLWYAGMYISMMGILKSKEAVIQGSVLILWNIVYILLQDIVIFPRTFTNYREYQETTPFLIPNKNSIERCLKNRKERGNCEK